MGLPRLPSGLPLPPGLQPPASRVEVGLTPGKVLDAVPLDEVKTEDLRNAKPTSERKWESCGPTGRSWGFLLPAGRAALLGRAWTPLSTALQPEHIPLLLSVGNPLPVIHSPSQPGLSLASRVLHRKAVSKPCSL